MCGSVIMFRYHSSKVCFIVMRVWDVSHIGEWSLLIRKEFVKKSVTDTYTTDDGDILASGEQLANPEVTYGGRHIFKNGIFFFFLFNQ